MRPLFVYGTLMDGDLLRAVLGRALHGVAAIPARLAGFAVERAAGAAFPLVVPRRGAVADGLLLAGLGERDLARLEAYETALYRRQAARVETAEGPVEAELFAPAGRLASSGEPWRLADWQALHKAAALGEEGGAP